MILILGIDHRCQWDRKDKTTFKFISYVEQLCIEEHIELLAEEFSIQALEENNTKTTTVEDIAIKLKIEHLYCDPTLIEREKLGIVKGDDQKREREWLARLSTHLEEKTVFVCGLDHVHSFSELLRKDWIENKVCDDATFSVSTSSRG